MPTAGAPWSLALGDATAEAIAATFTAVYLHAATGIALLDQDGRPFEVNPACCRILGYPADQLSARGLRAFTHPEDVDADVELLGALVAGERDRYTVDKRFLRPDGAVVWTRMTVTAVRRPDGLLAFAVVTVEDFTERRVFEAELRRQALHDPLTGLPNRTLFGDRLQHALALARRTGATLAVLFVDLNGFKDINDSQGHAVGDAVLVDVARRVQAVTRDSDTLARWGGDEFVMLCEDQHSEKDAQQAADRVRQAVAMPVRVHGREHTLTASVGIAVALVDEPADGQELLSRADQAMYVDKQTGRSS